MKGDYARTREPVWPVRADLVGTAIGQFRARRSS